MTVVHAFGPGGNISEPADTEYKVPTGIEAVIGVGAGTVVLPKATGVPGRTVRVVNIAAAGTILTVKTAAGEKIKGPSGLSVTSIELGSSKTYSSLTLVTDGTDSHIV